MDCVHDLRGGVWGGNVDDPRLWTRRGRRRFVPLFDSNLGGLRDARVAHYRDDQGQSGPDVETAGHWRYRRKEFLGAISTHRSGPLAIPAMWAWRLSKAESFLFGAVEFARGCCWRVRRWRNSDKRLLVLTVFNS